MPKLGMPEVRKPQLIEATIRVIAGSGMANASVAAIGKEAGVSPSIINHYFGGKDGLLEACMRHLLKKLSDDLRLKKDNVRNDDPLGKVLAIVEGNFVDVGDTGSTWLAFWARSKHNPMLGRLQRVNDKRLLSFIRYELNKMLPREQSFYVAQGVAALIDGIWLRGILAPEGFESSIAKKIILDYVVAQVPERFVVNHTNNTNIAQ